MFYILHLITKPQSTCVYYGIRSFVLVSFVYSSTKEQPSLRGRENQWLQLHQESSMKLTFVFLASYMCLYCLCLYCFTECD